jgi:anthranilate synthase component 1
MSPKVPRLGQALPLLRRLPLAPDPLDLYAALSDGGRRPGTLLLETGDPHAESGSARSLVIPAAAARATCRGRSVHIDALSPQGPALLEHVARRCADHVALRAPASLVLQFPRCDADDAEERLHAPSPLDALRALSTGIELVEDAGPFSAVCAGVLAFDYLDAFEDLPPATDDPLGFPDYVFWLAESLVVVDPRAGAQVLCAAFGAEDGDAARAAVHDASDRLATLVKACERAAPAEAQPRRKAAPLGGARGGAGPEGRGGAASRNRDFAADLDDEHYAVLVERLQGHIVAGDVFQIVPSRTFRAPCADPLAAYGALRSINPSPYQFYVRDDDHILLGASPETAVRVTPEGAGIRVEVRPMAGTRPRGATPDLDDRLEAELRLSEKELAEHLMLVDLARNDVASVSIPGTRRVSPLLTVERYSHVMHLVSGVRGTLRPGLDALHAAQACAHVGTLIGAPKVRAAQLLRRVELTKRGPYGGAVGYLTQRGALDSAVVIRSAVVREGVAHVRAGAGVVHDSDPHSEAAETRHKAAATLAALGSAGDWGRSPARPGGAPIGGEGAP